MSNMYKRIILLFIFITVALVAIGVKSPVFADTAVYDATLKAPKCANSAISCNSGTLLNGRDSLAGGSEVNFPNNINSLCTDGTAGTYHSDESLDSLSIATQDGTSLAPGKVAVITATVWAYSTPTSDYLDLYYAPDATNPVWTLIGTYQTTLAGQQNITANYTIPSGGTLQAIRAHWRYTGVAGTCDAGTFNESDDLIFSAAPLPAAATTTGNAGYSYNYFYSAGTVTNNTGSTAWYGTAWGAGAGYSGTACSALPTKTDYSTIVTGTNNFAISAYVSASASTVYYFCVYVKDSLNNYYYSPTTFSLTTSATPPPVVSLYPAHTVDDVSAFIGSGTNAYLLSATGYFRYGTSNVACSSLPSTTTSGSAGNYNGNYYPSAVQITGLSAGTTYYYCYQATTTQGTTYSAVSSFTTPITVGTGCNLLPGSSLATSGDKTTLAGYLSTTKMQGTSVYKATVNGWTSTNFHTASDNQGPTLVLIKNAVNNKVIKL